MEGFVRDSGASANEGRSATEPHIDVVGDEDPRVGERTWNLALCRSLA
jgi:hypothetical protein